VAAEKASTRNLLAGNDDGSDSEDNLGTDNAIWLILTTKKHVVDKNRLRPGKISIPHSLNTSPSLSICLITADPQRAVKDVVADPSFPTPLSSRINKIIGYTKLKARYYSFESRRQLLSEHDVFLADDRIIMRLIATLGKIFYKSSKRPIPVRIAEVRKVNGKRLKKDVRKKSPMGGKYAAVSSPPVVAKEIERTLNSVAVHLAPATTAAVRVGAASFTPEQLAENVEAVVEGMINKFVTKGWKNLKAIYIKGASTVAMPIWLTSELWVEEGDVRENDEVNYSKTIEDAKKTGKKRQSTEEDKSRSKKNKVTEPEDDTDLITSRRAKLLAQKSKALLDDSSDSGNEVISGSTQGVSAHGRKKRKPALQSWGS
jgi:ribosome biogenesis protein UTP30